MIQAWPPRAGRAAHQMPVRGSEGRGRQPAGTVPEGFGSERGDRLAPDVHHWAQHEGALPGVEELSVAESAGSIGVPFGRHEAAADLVYPPGEAVIDPLVDEVGPVQLRVIARVGDHDAAGQDHRVALDWLACGHSFPQVDPEPDSASGQAEARRRDETRPGVRHNWVICTQTTERPTRPRPANIKRSALCLPVTAGCGCHPP